MITMCIMLKDARKNNNKGKVITSLLALHFVICIPGECHHRQVSPLMLHPIRKNSPHQYIAACVPKN